jgi:hypothetical protein
MDYAGKGGRGLIVFISFLVQYDKVSLFILFRLIGCYRLLLQGQE